MALGRIGRGPLTSCPKCEGWSLSKSCKRALCVSQKWESASGFDLTLDQALVSRQTNRGAMMTFISAGISLHTLVANIKALYE